MKQTIILILALILSVPLLASAKAERIDSIAAVVNDNVITALELERQIKNIKNQLRAQNAQLPPAEVLRKQVLEREILKQIQLQLAQMTGIRVDDNELNSTLNRIASQNNVGLREFRNLLESEGFAFAEFRENIRHDMIMARLRQREVNNRITISDQEIQNFLATQTTQGNIDDEFDISHILVSAPEAASAEEIEETQKRAEKILAKLTNGEDFQQVAIGNSDGQNALEGGKLGWRKAGQLPTLFSTIVTHMKVGEHSELIRSSSGFHIIKLNEKRSGEKHIIIQTLARHILLQPNELNTEMDVITRLRQLRERILVGDDFAEIAKSHSEDRTSATLGGDLGWVGPGQMVPQFESAMNSLKVTEVSEPFQSQFGWHIVQVQDRREVDNSEQFSKNKAREFIRQRKTDEIAETWLRQLREEAFVEIKER